MSTPTMSSTILRRIRQGITVLPFLAKLPGARTTSDPEFAVDFAMNSPLIRPGQVRWEFEQLANLVHQLRPKAAMEIGTLRGGTLFALCRLSDPRATIISVDLPGGSFGGGYGWLQAPILRRFAGSEQALYLIRGDSHNQKSYNQVAVALAGKPLDFLLIDGDHSYAGVKQDFEMYSQLVRPGGVIALHDIADHPADTGCEVSRFWKEIKRSFNSKEIVSDPRQGWAGIGVVSV
jgi:predicted O-methyltransferase YrrM